MYWPNDLGWGDVGFHGSEIKTPCLDALVGEGVELERFYTSPISTPTRAGLMTGRYPNRFGVRSAVIPPWREDGLDENEETMADMLARNGYKNRAIIGKWHLGHTKKVHYPMNRGFSHFYGHLNGAIDYFDLTRKVNWTGTTTGNLPLQRIFYRIDNQRSHPLYRCIRERRSVYVVCGL